MPRHEFTPKGVALHCYVNEPDRKFTPDRPKFKTKLILEGGGAEALKAKIDARVDEAFEELLGDKTPAQKKGWTKAYPYEAESDDAGNETGRTIFKFSQNAIIKRKDGTLVDVKIGIYDSKKGPTRVKVFGGSIIKVGYSMRSYPKADAKQVGVTLDLAIVQVIQPASRDALAGLEEEADGWVDDGDDFAPSTQSTGDAPVDGGGDF